MKTNDGKPTKRNILLYIETSGPGGAETVLLNIASNLDQNQFVPAVILHRSRWLHEQLIKRGIKTEIIPSPRSWDMPFLYKLVKSCRRFGIDLIHSHLAGANLYGSLAGAVLRIPTIATYHNEMRMAGSSERYLPVKNFLIRNLASKIVFVADFMRDDYARLGKFPSRKMMTIYNGIDIASFDDQSDVPSVKRELAIEDDDLVVGNVANLRVPKGHHFLIDAAKLVCENFPTAKFLLIGEEGKGKLKEELEAQISRLQLNGNVKLLGFRDDVRTLLRIMDVFVLSSISEGLPLSVVEAMALSRPVVATRVGGMHEIVSDGSSGYLVEPADSRALAEKICGLLRDKKLRGRMGREGYRIAREKFSLQSMVDNYQKLYEELLS
jgi:glycosyltransferase involved in cell wall biosynthesis